MSQFPAGLKPSEGCVIISAFSGRVHSPLERKVRLQNGEEEMFDTMGTVGYSSAACGDAANAFDTVVSVVRNTAGHDLTTIPGALCIIMR